MIIFYYIGSRASSLTACQFNNLLRQDYLVLKSNGTVGDYDFEEGPNGATNGTLNMKIFDLLSVDPKFIGITAVALRSAIINNVFYHFKRYGSGPSDEGRALAKERIARGKFSKKIYVDAIEKLITANPKLSNDLVMKWRSLVLPALCFDIRKEVKDQKVSLSYHIPCWLTEEAKTLTKLLWKSFILRHPNLAYSRASEGDESTRPRPKQNLGKFKWAIVPEVTGTHDEEVGVDEQALEEADEELLKFSSDYAQPGSENSMLFSSSSSPSSPDLYDLTKPGTGDDQDIDSMDEGEEEEEEEEVIWP